VNDFASPSHDHVDDELQKQHHCLHLRDKILIGFGETKKEMSTLMSTKHVITDKGNASSRIGDTNLPHVAMFLFHIAMFRFQPVQSTQLIILTKKNRPKK